MEEKKGGLAGLLKTPKGWLIFFSIIAGIILLALFYKTAVLDVMSSDEVKNSIQVVWTDTKWVDKEVTPQEVKIVPTIRLKIKNVGKQPLQYMDMEAVFEQEDTGTVFSDGMVRLFKEPLQPGETSQEIVIKSHFGYTATSRAAFVTNKQEWKPLQAKLFARAKGSSLVRFGELYPIAQQIEGYDDQKNIEAEKPSEYANPITVALARSIQVVNQESQWVDKAPGAAVTIIVPSITVTLKNVADKPLENVMIKGIFMYEDTGEVLSEGVSEGISKALAPGDTGKPITVKADFGYSATSKEAFVYNNEKWKRLKVRLFAKSKESNDALLGTYVISQKIQGIIVQYKTK